MRVFVFGNGLSLGTAGGAVSIATLTDELWDWLRAEDLDGFVGDLQEWARPQLPGLDPSGHQYNFELVAGSLYRLGKSLGELANLATLDVAAVAGLEVAARDLGRLYQRIVSWILRQVDLATRNVDWTDLHAMASELTRLHSRSGVHAYTLNYDGMLMSALLEYNDYVYDGFRGNEWNQPLDDYGNITLYPLHGALGIYTDEDGFLRKTRLRDLRNSGRLESWVTGTGALHTPTAVLGDTKDSDIRSDPFAAYYDQLAYDLSRSDVTEVVVAGYGFGDRPLNRVLGRFLALDDHNRLRDWRPGADNTETEVADSLRAVLPQAVAERVLDAQIAGADLRLPDAAAVAAL